MKKNLTLTSFNNTLIEAEVDYPRPERLITGNPERKTWNHYECNGVSSGIWECQPGSWRISFDPQKDEFFHVLEGKIRLTNEAGNTKEFGPGEACIIPGGFSGIFEVLKAVKKHYVIIDRNQISDCKK